MRDKKGDVLKSDRLNVGITSGETSTMCFPPCNFIVELRCLDNASVSVMKAGQCRFKRGIFMPKLNYTVQHQMSHTAEMGTVYKASENTMSDYSVPSLPEAHNKHVILRLVSRVMEA